MSVTVVLPQWIHNEISEAVLNPLETAGVMLASLVKLKNGRLRLLARHMRWVPDCAYLLREADALGIASLGYIPALGEAEVLGAVALWVHTHPGLGAAPIPSTHDIKVDEQLGDLFKQRSGSEVYGALIFSPSETGLQFTGHVKLENGTLNAIERMWIVGDSLRLAPSYEAYDHLGTCSAEIYDRNIRAFGGGIQRALGNLTVGVVGNGGIGSSVAEQLVRLGVRNFVLIDPDNLSKSNVTRVYGSTMADVGRPKVNVLRDHLCAIVDGVQCQTLPSTTMVQSTAMELAECDVIFGCTDDNAGRVVLSRLATYMLTPVIDCGVLLSSDSNDVLVGIDGRVTTLIPGNACLICRDRIDLTRAASELLTPQERKRLESEGYAAALGKVEPAVVTFTTAVAAAAVTELLERLVGFGPIPRPTETLLRIHDREISTNIAQARKRHYCQVSAGKVGVGVRSPFLDLSWTK